MPSTYVALDLETTGLNYDRDTILEIGAVKFQGEKVVDTLQTLINPYREVPKVIQKLTGITPRHLEGAPSFASVAEELLAFIGPLPIVGHNVFFDLSFLSRHGVNLTDEVYDTRDLAAILLPCSASYSLSRLAAELGAEHTRPHRALPDAEATHMVFVRLLDKARSLDPAISSYINHLASQARWPIGRLFEGAPPATAPPVSSLGMTGLDMESIGKRLGRADRPLSTRKGKRSLDEEELGNYLAPGGAIARNFPGFEHRPQQVEMMRAVASALNNGEHLIVEGGTGVGKSLAYLLPALLYSVKNGTRVVVSTNTINLQEQLLRKDIPALAKALENEGIVPDGQFRAVGLKGRANYLCLRRWNQLARGETLSKDEARMLGKTLIWLQDTCSGDRAEINLSGKDSGTWSRVSAGEKGQCPGVRGEGACFLRAARDRAEAAHVIVVNHALLLSDLARGGGLLPEYQHLIVDEAQHLEEEATRQLGFQVSQNRLSEELDTLGRLLAHARVLLRGSAVPNIQTQRGEELIAELETHWSERIKDHWDRMWRLAEIFLGEHREDGGDQFQLRITRGSRAQPAWSDVEIAWENVDVGLADGTKQMERLRRTLETVSEDGSVDLGGLMQELTTWHEEVEGIRVRLNTLVAAPTDEQRIDWIAQVEESGGDSSRRSYAVLHSAPMNVGAELEARLFSRKGSVILTGATLSTQANFNYIRERTGLEECHELLVGSPFDYSRAALALIPDDMPLPDAWGYQQALERVLEGLARALEGHTLVLFTSHAALRGVARAIRDSLESEGIRVLAQGVDGSPQRILQSFVENPRSIILGTSSFWEGVDVSGGALKSVAIARLPFHVPTEPIFAARSAQYEESFHQYALPQAVLRFRQGIGRLIRSSQDRGAIVVLDKRIIGRPYGKSFLDSIPPCTVKSAPLSAIPGYAADWIGSKALLRG